MISRYRSLIGAVAMSAVIVLAAPVMGQIRGLLRSAFPKHFVAIVGAAVAGAIAVAMVMAVLRIQSHRAARYAAIAVALAIGIGYSLMSRSGIPDVDAVEHVHFVEYGVITLLFYRAWRQNGDPSAFVLPVLAGLLVGTLDEWLQWFVPVRVGEMRDVLLNLVAIGCGLLVGGAIAPPAAFSKRLRPESAAAVGFAGAIVVLVFAAFVNAVHGGYLVSADHGAVFRSHYTREHLEELARDRGEQWRTSPPVVLKRFSQEDQYMDEGLWHIRRRNEDWTAGHVAAAWNENLILERFFAPVLDTPSYAAPGGGRWPAAQRADAARQAGELSRPDAPDHVREGGSFVSDAQPYPILLLPRTPYWLTAGLSAAALIVFGLRRRMLIK